MVIPASVAVWQVLQQPLGWRRGVVVGLLALLMALGIKDSVRKERCAAKRAGVMLTTAFAAAGGALATYVLAQYTPRLHCRIGVVSWAPPTFCAGAT